MYERTASVYNLNYRSMHANLLIYQISQTFDSDIIFVLINRVVGYRKMGNTYIIRTRYYYIMNYQNYFNVHFKFTLVFNQPNN